ncbi:MAG: aminotransferase class V-fold PLP-dependent enzyme [Peptococcia bacterium]|jgi:cysteine desulfurase family protein
MNSIYFDNAATSFPKPPEVSEQIHHFLVNIGTNINRGLYDSSFSAANTVMETRELLGTLFHYPYPNNIVFTKNITESLNIIIKGLLQPGDHVLVSALEHNAVMRPLNSLRKKGILIEQIPCSKKGSIDINTVEKRLQTKTKAIIITHASNVCGTILPLQEIGRLCQEKNIFLIIDSAQTAGFLDLNFTELGASALAFTGHKGLLGPMGIGGFIINDQLAQTLPPLIEGGTGSFSEQEIQPEYLPDKFEAGTLNIPGIYGLNAALKYILKKSLKTIRKTELALTDFFLQNVKNIPDIKIIGSEDTKNRVPIVSLNFPYRDNAKIASLLAEDFQIMTRCGLHCAPSAHKALGTYPQGTVRFSFSHFNSKEEINYALFALQKICKN